MQALLVMGHTLILSIKSYAIPVSQLALLVLAQHLRIQLVGATQQDAEQFGDTNVASPPSSSEGTTISTMASKSCSLQENTLWISILIEWKHIIWENTIVTHWYLYSSFIFPNWVTSLCTQWLTDTT